MTTRNELITAIATRYQHATQGDKSRILDEFVRVSGFHRKHAMRLLRSGSPRPPATARLGRRLYDDAVREALIVLWEASDRVCGKRLRSLVRTLVASLERHGHLRLDPAVRAAVLAMSAATIDRALRPMRTAARKGRRRQTAPSAAIRRRVPIRTFADWEDPPPGFCEADLVAHSGPSASGSFVQTLVVTDIASGWTECAPLLVREQTLLTEVLSTIRQVLPFVLRGFDTDNDSVFLNETVHAYCETAGITFTRSRPYRKNDQAWVEQKNGTVVRRMVGYRRYEGVPAAEALARLYARVRLFVNFFQPSFKLAEKVRDGARVTKRYHAPATPCQRLLADPRTPARVRERLTAMQAALDPVQLLHEIREAQRQLATLPELSATDTGSPPTPTTLERFLAGLRTAWTAGEVRPIARPLAKARRERRRPDPFATTWPELRAWFDAEPDRTARELLERLQAAYPGVYPDGQLRTLQRRLKGWRRELAHAMVFDASTAPLVQVWSELTPPANSVIKMRPREHGDEATAAESGSIRG